MNRNCLCFSRKLVLGYSCCCLKSCLFNTDVDGKVVHLVQRAPPGPETRSSSTPRHTSRSSRQIHIHPNATFNGPAEDGEPLPFHHEMRRLMVNNACQNKIKIQWNRKKIAVKYFRSCD